LVQRAKPFDIDGITVLVASIDDLIRMKRAAGRAKDLIEVEVLAAVRDERQRDDEELGGEA
jgi:predicted nucleotidyltransferase